VFRPANTEGNVYSVILNTGIFHVKWNLRPSEDFLQLPLMHSKAIINFGIFCNFWTAFLVFFGASRLEMMSKFWKG
jgi:hypothetical protein